MGETKGESGGLGEPELGVSQDAGTTGDRWGREWIRSEQRLRKFPEEPQSVWLLLHTRPVKGANPARLCHVTWCASDTRPRLVKVSTAQESSNSDTEVFTQAWHTVAA